MPKYVIGVDFGTLSGRASLVDAADGRVLSSSVYDYPHAVMDTALPCGVPLAPDWALQHPKDYMDVLDHTIPEILCVSGVNPADVVNLAPWLKPSILAKLSESMEKCGIGIAHLVALAEYLNDTDTDKLMKVVDFDSLADMDMGLLSRLMPLLGPYAHDTILQKIIDGELDYHYLELVGGYRMQILAWAGDEEFPPNAQVLYSDNFADGFAAEDRVVAGDILISTIKANM